MHEGIAASDFDRDVEFGSGWTFSQGLPWRTRTQVNRQKVVVFRVRLRNLNNYHNNIQLWMPRVHRACQSATIVGSALSICLYPMLARYERGAGAREHIPYSYIHSSQTMVLVTRQQRATLFLQNIPIRTNTLSYYHRDHLQIRLNRTCQTTT